MPYKKTILKNGVRLLTVPMKGNQTVTVMIMTEVGSRYEDEKQNGLSHFLEHMCFKGTENRTGSQISTELDGIGAHFNAFTFSSGTAYYAKTHHSHLEKTLDILSDMYLHSNFPEDDLNKERGVIIEEINMYEDLPQRKVQEVFDRVMFGNHPLGRPTIGPKENIKNFTRQDFIDYRKKYYNGKATIVVVAGNFDQKKIKKQVEKHLAKLDAGKLWKPAPAPKKLPAPAISAIPKKTDQSHLVMGFKTFGVKSPKRKIMRVLSCILGGGMSSRLFAKMREQLGICYYIRSGAEYFSDTGNLTISSGVGNGRLKEAVQGILDEIKKLRDEKVSSAELDKAKQMIASSIAMGMETSEQNAEFYVEQELYHEDIITPEKSTKETNSVTAEQIQKLAKEIFRTDNIYFAVVGPNEDEQGVKNLLTL